MPKIPQTLEELFESATPTNTDIEFLMEDDTDDDLLGYLQENRKISIFDSDFLLEGEM